MNHLYAYRYFIRRHAFFALGFFLCVYFSANAVSGERSIFRLNALRYEVSQKKEVLAHLETQNSALEKRIRFLRPGFVSQDFMEEQVRLVLGYQHEDEVVVLSSIAQSN